MPTNPTDAQSEASRRNGAHSRGPITDAGKARSAQNGFKHGLRSATVVLNNESLDLYAQLRETYIRKFKPADQPELDLVTQMVNAQWRLRRIWAQEAAMNDVEIFGQQESLNAHFAKVDVPTAQFLAFKAVAVHDRNTLERFEAAEHRLGRQYDRAFKCLRLMQQNKTSEPKQAVPPPLENISAPESDASGQSTPAIYPTPSDTETVMEQTCALPESNATEERVESRYQLRDRPEPSGPPLSERFQQTVSRDTD